MARSAIIVGPPMKRAMGPATFVGQQVSIDHRGWYRRRMTRLAILVPILVAACGDDGGSQTPIDSGGSNMDAGSAAKVVAVACPGTPAATVTTTNAVDAYMPMNTTISAGAVVRFVMSTMHNVEPNPIAAMSDSATRVDYGETKCLRFDVAGTYGIYCAAHSFAGTITVQ
jgi:plastocyanin